jgi:EpsI family protein
MKRHWRFAVSAILLAGTALVLEARNGREIIPQRRPLSSFPRTLDTWTGTDVPMTQDVLDVLGPGDFLLRDYRDTNPHPKPDVFLFIAYFPSQRAGDTIHSPKNCLPGAGWTPIRADRITVDVAGRTPFQANRYLIAKGDDRQLVLYWYWAHDRAVASEYAAKFYLIADSIRMHRTDGSLVRLSMPLAPGESSERAERDLIAWAARVVPLLNTYIPQ